MPHPSHLSIMNMVYNLQVRVQTTECETKHRGRLLSMCSLTWNMLFKLTSSGWSFEVHPPGMISLLLWWVENSATMPSPLCGS